MKKIFTAFIFCFLCSECFSQAGAWVWIKGDSVPNHLGDYGVQGVPSPTNNPPSLYEPCEWTDLNGNFWLFGGVSYSSMNADLWKYDPISNEWTWMKGSGIANDTGNYGIQGIPSLTNNPPYRGYGVTSWVDSIGNLWLFGGSPGYNDLWKYDISSNEWTWMKGSDTISQSGIYGNQGIPDSANNPGSRWETAAAWTDNSGNLWLFGGFKEFVVSNAYNFNDLWRYRIASNQWTWMKGSQLTNELGTYGILGTENSANTPGARIVYSHWKDNSGFFWLFGGHDIGNNLIFNDVWRFNPSTNNWTWMGGDSSGYAVGMFGTKCITSSGNIPRGRYENRACWQDKNGNFWFFGGVRENAYFWNDLWKYCPLVNQWIWASGDSIPNSTGIWGTKGISNPFNKPNARIGSVGWSDNNNHLYLFGGTKDAVISMYNDLWKYTIDTTCGVCPAPNSIEENNLTDQLLIFPNPTNSSLIISFSSSSNQTIELRIYNTLGKQIYFSKEAITKGNFEKEINVEKLSDGIYFLQLKTKEGNLNRKVIVQH